MSRYRGPRSKIIKRLGNLPGFTNKLKFKKSLIKTENPSKQGSQYSIRLKTKQKLRYYYGITERKLIQYIQQAKRSKESTGKILLELLEMRLDNILYRANITSTIPAARQLINHGFVYINNKKVTIPSYLCKPHLIISFSKEKKFKNLKNLHTPTHLSLNVDDVTIKVNNLVNVNEIGLKINELFVIEYYSRS